MGGMPSVSNVLQIAANPIGAAADKLLGKQIGSVLNPVGSMASAGGKGVGDAIEAPERMKKAAEDAAAKQEADVNRLIADRQSSEAQQSMIKTRDLSRARQRAMSANAGGRSSTILTGPSGVSTGYVPGRKTLLGQ